MHQCRVFRIDTSRAADKTEWTERGEIGFTTLETFLINGVDVAQSNSPFYRIVLLDTRCTGLFDYSDIIDN